MLIQLGILMYLASESNMLLVGITRLTWRGCSKHKELPWGLEYHEGLAAHPCVAVLMLMAAVVLINNGIASSTVGVKLFPFNGEIEALYLADVIITLFELPLLRVIPLANVISPIVIILERVVSLSQQQMLILMQFTLTLNVANWAFIIILLTNCMMLSSWVGVVAFL
jgi:hypothetical protein